ncbi:hypothetical protein [Treponema parvum]|uniref:hypothetical protein n=1 Tax=Treponema parvum TaxID=138851 RepID=UPI00211DDEF2|nr:hypothetical protein [Treponema parvum]
MTIALSSRKMTVWYEELSAITALKEETRGSRMAELNTITSSSTFFPFDEDYR